MTRLTNEQGRALLAAKGKRGKAQKPPPIKMPKEAPAMQTQLDMGQVEKVLDRFKLLPPEGCYVEYHPTHRIYITEGITFILKPLET